MHFLYLRTPCQETSLRLRRLTGLLAFLVALIPLLHASSPDDAIVIQHGACAESCPVYRLTIARNGVVHYEGSGFVKVFGARTWSIPESKAEKLFDQLDKAGLLPDPSRPGKFLVDGGDCDKAPESHAHLSVHLEGKPAFPIADCYSPEVKAIIEAADNISQVSIYTSGHDEQSEAAIRTVIENQQAAWNRGDLDGFMAGYWNSPALTFFSGGSETSGWTETLDRYRKAYKSGNKQMGKLTFGGIRIEMLSPDAAFVRGQWGLVMPDGKTPHGLFTLIFRRFPEGWRIVHDSTGSA